MSDKIGDEPFQLKTTKLLLVEGSHEVSFFTQFLRSLEISDIQVKSVNGKTEFRKELQSLSKVDRSDKLTALGLIRDADDNFQSAFTSLQDALGAANYPVPELPMQAATKENLRTFIFIAPDNHTIGALEDLCLASIEENEILACVDHYFACLEEIGRGAHPRLSKAKIQVYLAKENTGDCSFARASNQNLWNWQSPAFESIRQFIRSL